MMRAPSPFLERAPDPVRAVLLPRVTARVASAWMMEEAVAETVMRPPALVLTPSMVSEPDALLRRVPPASARVRAESAEKAPVPATMSVAMRVPPLS